MVEVFKTNIPCKMAFEKIILNLQLGFPECDISFDEEDDERIVRIQGKNQHLTRLCELIKKEGYNCEILE